MSLGKALFLSALVGCSDSPEPTPEAPKAQVVKVESKFDAATYQAPGTLQVYERENRGSDRTVLFLPDRHLSSECSTRIPAENRSEACNKALSINYGQMMVLDQLAQMRDQVDVVLENLIFEEAAAYQRDLLRGIVDHAEAGLKLGLSRNPSKVHIHGSVDRFRGNMRRLEALNKRYQAAEMISEALEDKNPNYLCKGKKLTLNKAQDGVVAGKPTEEEKDCYCKVHNVVNTVIEDYRIDRRVKAPIDEMKAASTVPNTDLVVLIAGVAHLDGLRENAETAGMNWLVVSTKEADLTASSLLPLLDPHGICTNWKE